MTDEEYELVQDTRDKKHTARSARKRRTHCGKGGLVRFPSDNLTKKELRAMSGECKSWRLNEPMKWADFRNMPVDIQKTYIQLIQTKYDAPVTEIAKMMGCDGSNLRKHMSRMGIPSGGFRGKRAWAKAEFEKWIGRENPDAGPAEDELCLAGQQNVADAIPDLPEEADKIPPVPVVLSELIREETGNAVDWKQEYDRLMAENRMLTEEKARWLLERNAMADEMSKLGTRMEGQQMLLQAAERRCEILQAKVEMAELIFGGRKCAAEA